MFFRGYDPATGRMLQVDPYATMFAFETAYSYSGNNPISFNDPSGGIKKRMPKQVEAYISDEERAKGGGGGGMNSEMAMASMGFSVSYGSGGGGSFWGFLNALVDGASDGVTILSGNATSAAFNLWQELGSNQSLVVSINNANAHFFTNTYNQVASADGNTGVTTEYMGSVDGAAFFDTKDFVVLDANGNKTRHDKGANLIFVDSGNGNFQLFDDALVRNGSMEAEAFSNGLMSILKGTRYPDGTQFDPRRLFGGHIMVSLEGGKKAYTKAAFSDRAGMAYTLTSRQGLPKGWFSITYQFWRGKPLTLDSIRSLIGYHEYYAHGIRQLSHANVDDVREIGCWEREYYNNK